MGRPRGSSSTMAFSGDHSAWLVQFPWKVVLTFHTRCLPFVRLEGKGKEKKGVSLVSATVIPECGADICTRADSYKQAAAIRNRASPWPGLFWKPRCQIWIGIHTNELQWAVGSSRVVWPRLGCFGYPVQLLHPSRSLEPLPHVDWGNLEVVRKNKFPRAGTCSRHVPTTMQVPHNCILPGEQR